MDKQTHGLHASVELIRDTVIRSAPYDGCLAFSQGCAVAAVLVALQELKQCHDTQHHYCSAIDNVIASCNWNFSFVMLCSGHVGACPQALDILAAARLLQTPSLHLFGAPGNDKQVEHNASLKLFRTFSGAKSIVHNKGHVIPAAKTDVQIYTDFFTQALRPHCD